MKHLFSARAVSLVLSFFLVSVTLTSCSSGTYSAEAYQQADEAKGYSAEEAYYSDADYNDSLIDMYSYEKSASGSESSATQADDTAKFVYTASVSLETKQFDNAIAALEALVAKYKGYIGSSDINGYTTQLEDGTTQVIDRSASYTVCVPCDSFEAVLAETGTIGNVTNSARNAENVTSQYIDMETRIESLSVQEERILAMMEEATDVDTLITLESRLSEITYEKESYQRQLDNLERRISYSTITVYVEEVGAYTPTATVTRTFGQKLSDAFSDGWYEFTSGCEDFLLFVVAHFPSLIVNAGIILAVILLVRRSKKRKLAKKVAMQEAIQPKSENGN